MRFVIPILSLVALAVVFVWVISSGQLNKTTVADKLSFLADSVPHLLLAMFIAQVAAVFLLIRFRGSEVVTNVVKMHDKAVEPKPSSEQVNTEWVLDALAGGVIVANQQGVITYMNTSAEKLTLWQRDKVLGEHVSHVLKLEDLQGNPIGEKAFETNILHPNYPLQFGQVKLYPRIGEERFVELNTTCILEHCKAVVFIFRDVTADRKVINRLYRQASRDALTDLMNRSSFEQYVEQLAHDTSALTRSHVLASVDLDNFKIINDTCGHLAGDELLKQVAQIFRRSVRRSDKVARIGGDEFAVFLEGCGLEKGRTIMESILTELRNFRFSWEGKVFSIGASVGLIEFMPASNLQIKQLFSDADKACYTAKALGRNQVFIHAEEKREQMSNQRVHDWSKLLKDALREDRFILFAQPVVPLHTGRNQSFRQYEVLLRLPFRQALLNPGSFLPVADRLDLMTSIDRWIIRKALEMLAGCRGDNNNGTPCMETRLMINLSGQSVQDARLFPYVEQQIKQFGIDPGMICFEISESVAISNFVHAKRVMNALHSLGCHLVLDDFGSGFSSLSYLRELPLSYLKIDGNFVHNLVSSPVDAAMVKAVHEVGQVMNLLTIAELVEDGETLVRLRQIGVDFAQGYYCGRPIPLVQLRDRLQSERGVDVKAA
ncbi:PAS domain S-box-containing protein/diguanylate cyclase (GGDEF) domain-containing protein [Thiothrix caldifontis]|uniref:PAS domain S-box-containing protein/diguanylate cyclase (GGDEF) domain-containing protein n=1 Tax=Thiothrix caldifontis TaxID=525918 RepID=A0A1H4FDP5_9GAMM|nr:EAL domain-containing protein [Thiothrix caldifontis]SEA95385.1 PAS domain S-box-containing protein/diguanylate cyclase (GGDEF) domain-containing protein [Thiothrix caldifontis]